MVLALGAAAAAYAALNEHSPAKTTTVAQTPAPSAAPEATAPGTTTQATPPATTATPGGGASGGSAPSTTGPPSIPKATPTPTASEQKLEEELEAEEAEEAEREEQKEEGKGEGSSKASEGGGENNGETGEGSGEGTSAKEETAAEREERELEEEERERKREERPAPILLDTNAAHVYNPHELPEEAFGDPSLAIDGDETTVWKVKVPPEGAPKVDAGLSINLKVPMSVAQLTLITGTPGMTVKIYGTQRKHLPKTLDAEGWVKLSGVHVAKKRKSIVKLRYSKKKKFRQLLIWIAKAPKSSTPEAPGHVAINEVELYERS